MIKAFTIRSDSKRRIALGRLARDLRTAFHAPGQTQITILTLTPHP